MADRPGPNARSVNPLRFPANTTILVLLLAVSVIASTFYISGFLGNAFGSNCLRQIPLQVSGAATLTTRQFDCLKTAFNADGRQTLTRTFEVLVILALFYAANSRIYFRRYVHLGPEHRGRRARVTELALRFYPGRSPALGRARDGRLTPTLTVGTPRKPAIVFSHHDLACFDSPDPEIQRRFDGVVLHELAHVDAGDLRRYQLARAVRTLIVIYIGLCLVVLIITPDRAAATAIFQIGLVALSAELVVRAFLRAREWWADARAAAADRPSMELAFARLDGKPSRSIFASHPTHSQRLAALHNPFTLLDFPGWYSLCAGFLGSLSLSLVASVVGYLYWGTKLAGQEAAIAVYLAGIPLTTALSLGLWRQAWADRICNRQTRSAVLTVALAAGMIIGQYASPLFALADGLYAPAEFLPIAAPSIAAALALTRWPIAVAAGWFPPAVPGRGQKQRGDANGTFRQMKQFGIVIAFLVMGRVLAAWLLFCRLADQAVVPAQGSTPPPNLSHHALPLLSHVLRTAAGGWQAAIILTLAWLYPLAPRFTSLYRRGPAIQGDRSSGIALRHGMLWGAVAFVATAISPPFSSQLQTWAGLGVPLPPRWGIVVAAMALASATTSARIRTQLAGPYAMAAAFMTALAGLASLLVSTHALTAQAITDILAGGQLVAAASTLVISGVLRAILSTAGAARAAGWPAPKAPGQTATDTE